MIILINPPSLNGDVNYVFIELQELSTDTQHLLIS